MIQYNSSFFQHVFNNNNSKLNVTPLFFDFVVTADIQINVLKQIKSFFISQHVPFKLLS